MTRVGAADSTASDRAGSVGAGPTSLGTARRSQLRRSSAPVRDPVATVELLRADAGGVARASGWWSPAGLVLQRCRPGRPAPYVRTPAAAFTSAIVRALGAGRSLPGVVGADDRPPRPQPVEVGSVREVLAVARGARRPWISAFGAHDPAQLALLRWEVRWPDGRELAVRALVAGPEAAAVLHDGGRLGACLRPTDDATEVAVLGQVYDALVVRCHLEVAGMARTSGGAQATRSATSTPSRIGASELT